MGKRVTSAADGRLDTLRTVLRKAGLKCTPARLAVMQTLAESHRPSTHSEIHEALAARGFDRATIYRNLNDLQHHRLVSRVEIGDQAARFELAASHAHGTAHPHFLCENCGDVLCLDGVKVVVPKTAPAPGKPAAAKATGGSRGGKVLPRGIGSVTDIFLRGRCTRCG